MPPDIRKRKPTCLIFIRHECSDQPCLKKTYEKMIKVCQALEMEKFDEVVLNDHASEQLREKDIPELWLHDFQSAETPEPMQDYYVLKFDDGSMKVVLMLSDAEPIVPKRPAQDPMYR